MLKDSCPDENENTAFVRRDVENNERSYLGATFLRPRTSRFSSRLVPLLGVLILLSACNQGNSGDKDRDLFTYVIALAEWEESSYGITPCSGFEALSAIEPPSDYRLENLHRDFANALFVCEVTDRVEAYVKKSLSDNRNPESTSCDSRVAGSQAVRDVCSLSGSAYSRLGMTEQALVTALENALNLDPAASFRSLAQQLD